MSTAKLILDGKEYEFPVVIGSENEVGIDIGSLRSSTGAITLDPGYANTGACESAITFIDGEQGILRYRGYPIENIVEAESTFIEVAYLLIYGRLPNRDELAEFSKLMTQHSIIHEDMKNFFNHFPPLTHPMAILSAMLASLSGYYTDGDEDLNMIRVLAKAKTISAYAYKKSIGEPFIYPRAEYSYPANILHMMFSHPMGEYEVPPVFEEALRMLLILHADHEQNCSTSTVRMVGSSGASLFASISAGVCALWGPLHGGANQEVIQMLESIRDAGGDYKEFIRKAKDKDDPFRLMGFGHRVYKNYDPRARILKKHADEVLALVGTKDPLLDIAVNLEDAALHDDYFVERKLYPNVDFYSGLIYKAMGIPTNMFTVMFALGRIPGWIAHWKEMREDPATRINRPRQVYTGPTERAIPPRDQRQTS